MLARIAGGGSPSPPPRCRGLLVRNETEPEEDHHPARVGRWGRVAGLIFRRFRGRNFNAEPMKIGFKGFFDNDIRGASPVNRKMANDFDDFGPEPEAGLYSVYVTFGPRHVKKIERMPQSVNIIILTQYNNGITVLYIIGIGNNRI